jgi:L-fucose isomerase-like protein
MSTFGYLVVASPLHDPTTVERVTFEIRAELDRIGGTRIESADSLADVPLAILLATGGTEAAVLEHLRMRQAVTPFEPALLLAHPLHNSLPAALEALARVRADGGTGRIVQVGTGSSTLLSATAADVQAIHRLHRTRLGQVGEPSAWLVASVPDPHLLRTRWGIELVPVDIGATIESARGADPTRVRPVAVRIGGSAEPTAAVAAAATLHPALVDAIGRAKVDAVTVRCFDYLAELSTSGCIALAELNDVGVVAGCEGDVASAVAMLLVRALFDQPSWIANPASIDEERNRVLLAHCTVAPSLVEHIELHTHFESGLGVGLRGYFACGPVTLLRLGGSSLEQMWISEGRIESAGCADDLCRTQVVVQLVGGCATDLLQSPLGNHLVLFHGHHRARVEGWWRLAFG